MDMIKGSFRRLGKRNIAKVTFISLAAATVMAAALFIPNNQPPGYIAPLALNTQDFSSGTAIGYTPWFETGTYRGDLIAFRIASSGAVNLLSPVWRAASVLDLQDHLTGRRIVTTDGAGVATPFRFLDLTPAQQGQVGSNSILNYVRGDRSNEGPGGMRPRSAVLGDIIHSGPAYVGRPIAGYTYDNYLAFASNASGRAPRVYVGANDGMLHAFDAVSGTEVFAYVPSMVLANLPKLAVDPYRHTYFVDGFLTAEDAQFGGAWHTVLIGGLGAGGKGYYALDVTSASAATEVEAAGKILWEFNSSTAGAANLGFGYSRPSVVRLANDDWAAIVANGYMSATGAASLYVLNIQTGAVIREMITADLDGNGLSSPTVIDLDGDGRVDSAYAGDLNGNLWKFDLNAGTIAFGGQPLFQTLMTNGVRQPITTAPEVGRHPEGGVMVYVGTGRLLAQNDAINKSTQAVFGIWDDDSGPVGIVQLRTQQLKSVLHASGEWVRVVTANSTDWSTHRGWVTPTAIAGATTLDLGERVIQDMRLRDGRISFTTVNPSLATGENWFIQLDAMTGGAPGKTIIDVNDDLALNVADNVDGNGDGAVLDGAEDRAVGQYQDFGLASRPVTGVLGDRKDSALINHLAAISPALPPNLDDPGLLGGHFDLDTSHEIYDFNFGIPECDINGLPEPCVASAGAGTTDGHVHQWDDKNFSTTINFFNLADDGDGNPLYEIDGKGGIANLAFAVEPDEVFMLTVANSALSPGGVLEINGGGIGVVDYQALLNRYLAGTLGPGESFPLYKLKPTSAAEEAQGIVRLQTLKLSFDAFAILSGDLLPTKTGCVRGNSPGALGEYRNGALMLQALDASDVSGGFVYDAATERYVAGSSSLNAPLGYATAGLHWESTVFWHWDGPCYGEAEWAALFDECVIQGLLGICTKATKEEKNKGQKKSKFKKNENAVSTPPGLYDPSATETDPGQSVTNTTVGGADDIGRLFWKELVPEE